MSKSANTFVPVPEVALSDSGILPRYWSYGLAVLRKYPAYANVHKQCCVYTAHMKHAVENGMGVCLFGPVTEFRKHAFYGILKAAIAQGYKVQVVDVEDAVQMYSEKSEGYPRLLEADILAFPEMELPHTSVNNFVKTVVHKLIRKRVTMGKPVVVATACEVEHPDHSLDILYPGVAALLKESTLLVNLDASNQCRWVTEGHAVTVKLLGGETVKVVPKKRIIKVKRSVK